MTARMIEFSGADGVGKTTAFTYLCHQLETRGKKILRTREVGSPHIPICTKLRELILDPTQHLDGKTMECVFAAMRIENQRFYASVKDQYDYIVSDRGILCHLAYTDHNVSPEFTEEFYYGVVARYTSLPDMILLFMADPQVALSRITKRGEAADAIEAKGTAFQEKVIRSYTQHANRLHTMNYEDKYVDIHVIDANRSIADVQKNMDMFVEALCSH